MFHQETGEEVAERDGEHLSSQEPFDRFLCRQLYYLSTIKSLAAEIREDIIDDSKHNGHKESYQSF